LTELWLSAVSTRRVPASKGYASPTSRQAPVAFGVKMTAYSSGEALKKDRIVVRVRSMSAVAARDVGLSECGLPKHPSRRRSACAASWAHDGSPAPV
jgi:hypothetical protein